MSRPHPALVDLALGRDLEVRSRDPDLVRSAIDHRMDGLLWSQVRDGRAEVGTAERSRLAAADLLRQRRAGDHWAILVRTQQQLAAQGLETVALKGVTAEARWYDRVGERPTSDVDLWLDPRSTDRFPEAVTCLDPTHPLRGSIGRMLAAGDCQGVEVEVPGTVVDLHADPYKVRARLPGVEAMFDRRVHVMGPADVAAWALAPEDALLQQLVHLNRDWFRSLIGYVDILRIAQRGELDWPALWRAAEGDGLTDVVTLGLREVDQVLPLGTSLPTAPNGWRSQVWHRAWPEHVRLSGHEGVPRQRRRHDVITVLIRGHVLATMRGQWRSRLFPSRAMVDHAYPGQRGSYLRRLLYGRVRSFRHARQTHD